MMAHSLKHYDALFVINQDCNFLDMASFCASKNFIQILFLSTHSLFEDELEFVKTLFPVSPDVCTFADLLDDSTMERCDEDAYEELLKYYQKPDSRRDDYIVRFIAASRAYKNREVCKRIISSFHFGKLFCGAGLGIEASEWFKSGAIPMQSEVKPEGFLRVVFKKIALCFKRHQLYLLNFDNKSYLFLGAVKRLRIKQSLETIDFIPIVWMIKSLAFSSKERIFARFIHYIEKKRGVVLIPSTTIHGYEGWMSRIGSKVHIFVDGHHPENYPRTYIDGYDNSIFVTRTMFDTKWFIKYGKEVSKPLVFISPEYFSEVPSLTTLRTVVLLLNHAGDWTALVNRSDTDILIKRFVDCAKRFTNIHFVVRPHPTMTHYAHEGANSISRINNYVKWLGMHNLEVSSSNLEEDMSRGDLFISEYSQTLLDVYRTGKAAIIANFTSRRSFMIDYESIGFPSVTKLSELTDLISELQKSDERFVELQNSGASNYNQLLERYLSNNMQPFNLET